MTAADDQKRIERWVRAAYLAKGGIYLLLGVLCVEAVIAGGVHLGAHGVGRALLVLAGLGLAVYAVWRSTQGVLDFESDGSDLRGMLRRGGYLLSGILHGALAVAVVQLSAAHPAPGRSLTWVGELHEHPAGLAALGVLGVVVLSTGVYQMLLGLTSELAGRLEASRMSRRTLRVAVMIGRVGLLGRGLVLLALGSMLAHGAYGEGGGVATRGVVVEVATIVATPLGAALLVGLGLCLVAYGVHMLVWARYLSLRPARDPGPLPSRRMWPQSR